MAAKAPAAERDLMKALTASFARDPKEPRTEEAVIVGDQETIINAFRDSAVYHDADDAPTRIVTNHRPERIETVTAIEAAIADIEAVHADFHPTPYRHEAVWPCGRCETEVRIVLPAADTPVASPPDWASLAFKGREDWLCGDCSDQLERFLTNEAHFRTNPRRSPKADPEA